MVNLRTPLHFALPLMDILNKTQWLRRYVHSDVPKKRKDTTEKWGDTKMSETPSAVIIKMNKWNTTRMLLVEHMDHVSDVTNMLV